MHIGTNLDIDIIPAPNRLAAKFFKSDEQMKSHLSCFDLSANCLCSTGFGIFTKAASGSIIGSFARNFHIGFDPEYESH